MNASVEPRGLRTGWVPPIVAKARQWVSIDGTLAAARGWLNVTRDGLVVRIAVTASLLAVMLTMNPGHVFALVTAFGWFLLLCFPLEPMLSLPAVGCRVGGTRGT
jgi:hypothetical protein